MKYKYSRDSLGGMQFLLISFLSACTVIVVGIGVQWWWPPSPAPSPVASEPSRPLDRPAPVPVPDLVAPAPPIVLPTPSTPSLPAPPPPQKTESPAPVAIAATNRPDLGHFPYAEAQTSRLVQVGMYYDRPESLDREAADAFAQMREAARAGGVDLNIISGFRSRASQEKLFARQIQRRGNREAAARLSAPPGHSEHHTGYALDIGDNSDQDTDLKYAFERTRAYHWLSENANQYGFELSFPRNNPGGVSFEPWHWRFVGSETAAQIFAPARQALLTGRMPDTQSR
jgi:zinc D-Ala-D-Ala carboxypeptidase